MDQYYKDRYKELAEIENRATEKRKEWLYRIVLLSSTLFGVLISLFRPEKNVSDYIFPGALVFLGIGILCNGVALYSLYKLDRDNADKARREFQDAYRQRRKLEPIHSMQKNIFVRIEQIGGTCLVLSVCLLIAYIISLSETC